jgi:DNA (cytosine-5)-methyltransferase 1
MLSDVSHKRPKAIQTFTVASLFSGCGGMDLGFLGGFRVLGKTYPRLPFRIIWANDLNPAACCTYKRNLRHPIHCGDIWSLLPLLPKRADVVIGGFPCQDISINGKRAGIAGERSGLYRAMVEVVDSLRPRVFVAENVKGLMMKYNEKSRNQVIRDFADLGYQVTCHLYHAAAYGVPQNRERVFIVGTDRKTAKFIPPVPVLGPMQYVSAKAAIGDLEEVPEDPSINHIWSRANRSPEQGDRRLLAHRPAHTIRAECHGNIQYHYSLPRRISMREAARFQTFPDRFIFHAGLRETERMIGNAVPPVLAWHVARTVRRCLEATEPRAITRSERAS